jgi:hypothetical protein
MKLSFNYRFDGDKSGVLIEYYVKNIFISVVKLILGRKTGSVFNKGWTVEKFDRGKQREEYFHPEKLSHSSFRMKKKKKKKK